MLLHLHHVTNLVFTIEMQRGKAGYNMAQQRLILAIGRIERALSRIEQLPERPTTSGGDPDLLARHEQLKSETRAAIREIDELLERSID